MSDPSTAWNGELVRKWLERRFEASKLDQAAADRRGYGAQDDYDKAAAEEWVCRALKAAACTNEQAAFARRLKELIGQEDGHLRRYALPAPCPRAVPQAREDDQGE